MVDPKDQDEASLTERSEPDLMDQLPVSYSGLLGLSWLSRRELAFVADLILPGSSYLEIGSAAGVSSAMIADMIPTANILCLDTFVDSDDHSAAESDPRRYWRWLRNKRPNMRLFIGAIEDLVNFLQPTAVFNTILVDSGHDYERAYKDLITASSLLATGGSLLAHDYGDPNHPGVQLAVDEFCATTDFKIIQRVSALALLSRNA